MIRTLTSFNSTGIAVDPVTLKIVLPNHYDNVPPPASYGLSTDGKISYMTTVNDTAIGVFSILLVRRFYYAWKKYLEFRNLRKTLFLWGRRRLLKLVWDPLILYWASLTAAKEIGHEMHIYKRKDKMFWAWQKFAVERIRGKRKVSERSERALRKTRTLAMKPAKWLQTATSTNQANIISPEFVWLARFARPSLKMRTISLRSAQMLKKLFKRRCYAVMKLWHSYAQTKARRKHRADARFSKTAHLRGFETWRSHFLDTTRLKRKFNIIYKKKSRKRLTNSFREWYMKIIVNRRLLKRVFLIGLEHSKYFNEKRGARATSEFHLLRDVIVGWRLVVVRILETRSQEVGRIASESMWRIGLLCKVFLGWQRVAYGEIVCREMRFDRLIRVSRKCLAEWGKWSYKVGRLRYKCCVTNVLAEYFSVFCVGCVVSKKERRAILTGYYVKWVRRWRARYLEEPRKVRSFNLLNLVFKEWKWCALWAASEKGLVFEGEERRIRRNVNFSRPMVRKKIEEGLGLRLGVGVGAEVEANQVVQLPPSAGGGGAVNFFGRTAIDHFFRLSVERKIFAWWSKSSTRHRKLRRNLGKLSRLAVHLKLLDAFSKFPMYGWDKKVKMFKSKRIAKKVFKEWKMYSKSYLARKQRAGLSKTLREKAEKKLRLKGDCENDEFEEELDEDQYEEERDLGAELNIQNVRSFMQVVKVGVRSRMAKAWGGWRYQMLLGRSKKLEAIRFARAASLRTKMRTLRKWIEATHFISKRASENYYQTAGAGNLFEDVKHNKFGIEPRTYRKFGAYNYNLPI